MLQGSVYSAVFALSTMIENGRAAEAINQITGLNADGSKRANTHNWRHMMELGSGSTMEAWNEYDDLTVSHSHPWGTAPVILASQSIFGIKPLKPAYEQFQIKPVRNGLAYASVKIPTVRGDVMAAFKMARSTFHLDITVPANTQAYVYIPGHTKATITENGKPAQDSVGVTYVGKEDGYVKYRVGSGGYHFVSRI